MKRIIALLIMLVIFACNAIAEQDGYFILCHPDSGVFVRNRPDKSASACGWVMFGTFVKTDGKEKNGFVHVIDLAAEEPEGWISSGYLVYDKPRAETYKAEITDGRVNVRKCINGKRLRTLKAGQKVIVYARSNAWAVTNKGYIMCDWLREVDE